MLPGPLRDTDNDDDALGNLGNLTPLHEPALLHFPLSAQILDVDPLFAASPSGTWWMRVFDELAVPVTLSTERMPLPKRWITQNYRQTESSLLSMFLPHPILRQLGFVSMQLHSHRPHLLFFNARHHNIGQHLPDLKYYQSLWMKMLYRPSLMSQRWLLPTYPRIFKLRVGFILYCQNKLYHDFPSSRLYV